MSTREWSRHDGFGCHFSSLFIPTFTSSLHLQHEYFISMENPRHRALKSPRCDLSDTSTTAIVRTTRRQMRRLCWSSERRLHRLPHLCILYNDSESRACPSSSQNHHDNGSQRRRCRRIWMCCQRWRWMCWQRWSWWTRWTT